nr:MAG TPA: hypothetical protein [Caudoviricetes sp.]
MNVVFIPYGFASLNLLFVAIVPITLNNLTKRKFLCHFSTK